MAHLRKTIRDRIQTALTGLATTGSNVFPGRVHNLQASELPALLIYAADEQSTPQTIGGLNAPRSLFREFNLTIEGRVTGATAEAVEDLLDQIALEVEAALGATNLTGAVKSLDLLATEFSASGEGSKIDGLVEMTFRAIYVTAADDPETMT